MNRLLTLSGLLLCTTHLHAEKQINNLTLHYTQPAHNWNEALPIGNGSLGAMLHGGVKKSIINLNEDTLWSGEPSTVLHGPPSYLLAMKEAARLLAEGKYAEGDELMRTRGLGKLGQAYQPVGSLELNFHSKNADAPITHYQRTLDLTSAIHWVTYQQNGVSFTRETFASYPDKVIYLRLSANKAHAINFSATFTSPHPTAHNAPIKGGLSMKGQAPAFVYRRPISELKRGASSFPPNYPELCNPDDSLRFPEKKQGLLYGKDLDGRGTYFEAQVRVLNTDGEVKETSNSLEVSNAQSVILAISVATSYNGPNKSPSREGKNPTALLNQIFKPLQSASFKSARNKHLADYQKLFNTCSLTLGNQQGNSDLPTDVRLHEHPEDPAFAALMFQYGRYLLIASSRPGTQAANLQGIWSMKPLPSWGSSYTTNINVEMNYWPAEVTGLSECHQPLFNLIEESVPNGKRSAKEMYDINRGWVMHHNTSIWRETSPTDGKCMWFPWPMGSGWLCSHLWEHYAFTKDETFLRNRAYPVMKEAAKFYADWLTPNADGFLITPISTSPENQFIDEKGRSVALSPGATMDLAIIRELFSRVIESSKILNTDPELRKELEGKLAKILPYQIGKHGQLQEWCKDFPERDQHHRHISHLYALHPSNQITLEKTPKLFAAARKTLERRGDEATGWSMGWKINFWARMRDGDHAYKILRNLFNPAILRKGQTSKRYSKNGEYAGLYNNLFDAHPPFQIDGNFGYTAGVAEMLVQSHRRADDGTPIIDLLPALPQQWSEGSVSGLHVRGGFTVAITWKNHKITQATLTPTTGKKILVNYAGKLTTITKKTTLTP